MHKGLFITLEGGEGSGKTSVIDLLKIEFKDAIFTREPGGVKIAEQIRDVILDVENTEMDGIVEAMLYAASRRQHLVEKVFPALNENKLVICDRFVDSSIVYQGYARNIGVDKVRAINEYAIDNTYPDITFFLDITPELAFKRLHSREMNRLDLENEHFHELVYQGYKQLDDARIVHIDATQPLDKVVSDITLLIKKKMKEYE